MFSGKVMREIYRQGTLPIKYQYNRLFAIGGFTHIAVKFGN